MNRRSLLHGLLALPLAPVAAKLLPESASEWFLRWPERHKGLTLLDVVRRSDQPLLPVVEALSQRNKFLADVTWYESGLETGYRVGRPTKLPEVTFRRIN